MEPMDLDQHDSLSYRSNPITSASPPLSPSGVAKTDLSDMEVDPNSPPPSQYHPHINHHDNSRPRVFSSPSLDCMNQSITSILSLNNFTQDDGCSPQTNKVNKQNYFSDSPSRTCRSAPPYASPFFNQSTAESKLNVNFNRQNSKALEPDRARTSLGKVTGLSPFVTPKSKSKVGYGIRDDDEDHDALLSISKEKNMSCGLRSRGVQKTDITSTSQPASLSSHDKKSLNGILNSKPKKGRIRCAQVIKAIVFTAVILFSVIFLTMAVFKTSISPKSCDAYQSFQSKVLEVNLKTDLFGQHIASELIQKNIRQYFERHFSINSTTSGSSLENGLDKTKLCKPLVLSFHGWTGVGKNFGSQIIHQSFSQIVSWPFIIPLLFPHINEQELYANQIHDWITSNITRCLVNLFIIDEMDKAFPEVQTGLLKAIESLTSSCVISSSPVILILISNSHAGAINQVFVERYTNNPSIQERTDLTEEHFQGIFKMSPSSTPEWYEVLSSANAIDAFIPFLPLEKSHVIECIKRELINKHLSTDSHIISQVLKELSFSVFRDLELSTTGCKRVSDKVNYVIYNQIK